MTIKQSCKTCIHSRWYLTATGRIKKESAGKCVVELPVVVNLPDCVTNYYAYQKIPGRTAIWPDGGETCPLYNRNPGSLLGGG